MRFLALALWPAFLPPAAQAHLVSTGLGPFYDGTSHFALSPEEVFPVVALALLAGLRGPAPARYMLFTLPTAWALGGVGIALGLSLSELSSQIATAVTLILVGGLLVLEAFEIGGLLSCRLRVPRIIPAVTAALVGLIRGNVDLSSFMAAGLAPASRVLVLLGVVFTVLLLTALSASVSLSLKATWLRIAVCVTGSWSAALGILLVGWSIHLSFVTVR